MFLKILIIVMIITVGFLVSTTSLGGEGLIMTFLMSFGLFCVIGLIALVVLMKKNNQSK